METNSERERCKSIAEAWAQRPLDEVFERGEEFRKLLIRWNQALSLMSADDLKQFYWEKHFLDSIRGVKLLKTSMVLDFGSGAGFPGIPLGLMDPMKKIFLLERVRKKRAFLKEAVETLGLGDRTTIYGALEDIATEHRLEEIDIVVRAVRLIDVQDEFRAKKLAQTQSRILYWAAKSSGLDPLEGITVIENVPRGTI